MTIHYRARMTQYLKQSIDRYGLWDTLKALDIALLRKAAQEGEIFYAHKAIAIAAIHEAMTVDYGTHNKHERED
jgi:hypothetical protein